jgi:hypothetical protein
MLSCFITLFNNIHMKPKNNPLLAPFDTPIQTVTLIRLNLNFFYQFLNF